MKKWTSLYNIIILMGVFSCGGCTTYLIDSNPQGLRVSVDNIECGRTPCEYTWTHGGEYGSKIIRVYPPTRQQLKDYEQKNNKIVSVWTNEEIAKTVYSNNEGGTVFFQFITSEYDVPQTEKDAEWVKSAIRQDWEHLEKQRELILRHENVE